MDERVRQDEFGQWDIEYCFNTIEPRIINKKAEIFCEGRPSEEKVKEELILQEKIKQEDYYRVIIVKITYKK